MSGAVKYGCHCDLDPDMYPDGCVLDEGRPQDCVNARNITSKEQCSEWRPIAMRLNRPATPKPLTTAEMEKGREQIFSVNNPFCPCDSKTFRKVAEWVERHHGIKP